jgi:hypothetical protein
MPFLVLLAITVVLVVVLAASGHPLLALAVIAVAGAASVGLRSAGAKGR